MKLRGAAMTRLMVTHPCSTLLISKSRGGIIYPSNKLCWIYCARSMQYSEGLSYARMPIKHTRKCRWSMFVVPTAMDSQQLSEYGQSLIKVLQNEAAAAAKVLPVSASPQSSSENIMEGLVYNLSAVPIEVSIAAVAVLVGSTLGYLVAALPTSKRDGISKEDSGDTEPPAGEWLLVMNSTPFNRFVMMRCPSIMFEDVDVYEGLSKRLRREGHHIVKLRTDNVGKVDRNGDANGSCVRNDSDNDADWSGCVLQISSKSYNSFVGQVGTRPREDTCTPLYQRTFLYTEDGGVLAIDWPSHLELSGEHGLDTAFLLVPGSADGSADKRVQEFVQRSIRCGYFPIVLNPRGCGGSLLTTPRLFTAGDSDDVRTTVNFLLKSRPWATIMAVGWGYGANMLIKYLGEEAAATPVTAAVCIENVFDLEESSKLNQEDHDNCFNKRMTSGFVQILKSNQMVFEGKAKYFDVQQGLLAKSIRDFDEAISIVSKGYDCVQEFYKDSSSKSWIDNVKIPMLCIQDNNSIWNTFSIPRHSFEDTPFATLLLLLTRKRTLSNQTMARGHFDSLVIEWLAAVELAFLKGRHPLLQGVDLTFKLPMKGTSFSQQSQSSQNGGELMLRKTSPSSMTRRDGRSDDCLPIVNQRTRNLNVLNSDHSIDEGTAHIDSKDLVNNAERIDGSDEEKFMSERVSGNDRESHGSSDEDASGDDESETEQGQVRQATESIMKVLDVTMPGTLSEKKKEEVLEAVGRGETIVTALQEACPEDVRAKMATAVSAAVQASGISMKLAGFGKNMPAPKIPDGMVEKIQANLSSIVHNKIPAALTHDAAKSSLSDTAANNGNVVVGSGDQDSQHEDAKKLVEEGSDTKQPEYSTSPSPAAQNGNSAAIEPPHKAGSEVEQDCTQGQASDKKIENNTISDIKVTEQKKGDRGVRPVNDESRLSQGDSKQSQASDKEIENNTISDIKATEQENGDKGARPVYDDSRLSQGDSKQSERQDDALQQKPGENRLSQGYSVQAGRQGDALPYDDEQKPDGQDQKQESFGAAPQTNEPPQAEKRNESSTTSITSSSEDLNIKGLKPNVGELLSPPIPSQVPVDLSLPSLDMSQAFEAFRGLDDSTQMAVTNVFGVIENVLEQLEKEQGRKEELLEQPSLPEHESHPTKGSYNESVSEINDKQISLEDESSGDNLGQLDASETTTRQQIPGGSSDRELGESPIQSSKIRGGGSGLDMKRSKIDHNSSANLSSISTGLEHDSTFGRMQETDDVDLALEYSEDENVWKLIDYTRVSSNTQGNSRVKELGEHSQVRNSELDMLTDAETTQVIIPEYVTVDDEMNHLKNHSSFPDGNLLTCDEDEHSELTSESSMLKEKPGRHDGVVSTSLDLQLKVGGLVIDALDLELCRRLGDSEMRLLGTTLEQDVEKIGSAVAETVKLGMHLHRLDFVDKSVSEKIANGTPLQETGKAGKLHVETIIGALNKVYGNLVIIPTLLPAGVVYGTVLAALSPLDILSSDDAQDSKELLQIQRGGCDSREYLSLVQSSSTYKKLDPVDNANSKGCSNSDSRLQMEQPDDLTVNGMDREVDGGKHKVRLSGGANARESKPVSAGQSTSTNSNMMGTVAAAMGATAVLASERPSNENLFNSSEHKNQRVGSEVITNGAARFACESDSDQEHNDESKSSIVSTLAEKAMSVAAPVVPTKEDGGVDHDRLVEILAGMGQKGGILRLIGKVALLWGGLRGAMSLTDRLLVFLRMSGRPLYQRFLGFMVMALLLWSPVLVPLLPSLLQQWASKSHNGVASTAALIGLYGAVVILITIWGKTIRGYENPLHQYGVNIHVGLNARQLLHLMSGLTLGLSLVASVYLLGVSLQLILFDWAPALSFNSSKTLLWNLGSGWKILKLMVQCLGISLAVSFVEELFFRSWLQEEISADLGFHRATTISGLAFAVSHWYLPVMPALWLLSLILTGAKVGCNGDLNLAIGIHAGLIAGIQFINSSGQVKYVTNASIWFFGHQTGDPFTGLIGVSILGALALLFYPWDYNSKHIH